MYKYLLSFALSIKANYLIFTKNENKCIFLRFVSSIFFTGLKSSTRVDRNALENCAVTRQRYSIISHPTKYN